MCSRYTNTLGPEALGGQLGKPLGVQIGETAGARAYNIAPTEPVLAIVAPDTRPEARMLRWALVPANALSTKTRYPLINARLEGLKRTGRFSGVPADASHRALIVADRFIEWTKAEQAGKVKPQPFGFTVDGGRAFCFAGLWVVNDRVDGGPIASCTILTCDSQANRLVAPVHDRMPVILPDPDLMRAWIDPRVSPHEALSICGALPAERMSVTPLSQAINDVRNKHPEALVASR
jgi:putative SOS response-associated peptidase YedK